MTPQQWKEVESALSSPYGRVRLKADGHVLTLCVERGKGLRYVIAAYIDGVIDWKLCRDTDAELPRKFWREKTLWLYSAAERAKFAHLAKKRGLPADVKALYAESANAHRAWYEPCWPNAKALCRHLRKTCASVEQLPMFENADGAAQ